MARKAAAKKKAASKPYVITTLFDRPHVRITHTVMHPNAVISIAELGSMAIGSPFVCLYNHARGRELHVRAPRPSKRELPPPPAVAGTRGRGHADLGHDRDR